MFRSPADTGLSMDEKGSLQGQLDMLNSFSYYNLDDDGDANGFGFGLDTSDRLTTSSTLTTAKPTAHRRSDNGKHHDLDSPTTSTSSSSSTTKYVYPRIETIEVLRPEEIRWLYKEDRDKKWTPFIGYDSLRIECKYRELEQRNSTKTTDDSSGDESNINGDTTTTTSQDKTEDEVNEENETINVRGGLYQVDVKKKICFPIYWATKGQTCAVMRGTWFIDETWEPIDETCARDIEVEHLAKFEHQKLTEEDPVEVSKGPIPVIHHMMFKDFHIDWNAVNKVYLHSETTSSKLYRAVGYKLGFGKSGTKLQRGYCYEAKMDDKPADISHLVFVIHGIGQKMDLGSIVRNCGDLRESVNKMKDKHFPDLDGANQRVEFLPIEWRSSLKLDGDLVESITPNKVQGLRVLLNSTAMDILYYTSPLYRSEITQGLLTELNRLYGMFCDRHPYFEVNGGRVSFIAHSLGCVIAYDIVSGWNPIRLYDQYVTSVVEKKYGGLDKAPDIIAQLEHARKRVSDLESELLSMAENQHHKMPTLKFKLDQFFCLGSPLAVFLALRGTSPHNDSSQRCHILPAHLCTRLLNVYHPSDPVAYRLEPLILKHYATLKPVYVHRHDSSNKVPYDQVKAVAYSQHTRQTSGGSETKTTPGQSPQMKSGNSWSSMFSWGRKADGAENDSLAAEMTTIDGVEKLSSGTEEEDDDDQWLNVELKLPATTAERIADFEETELEYRLDYQLTQSTMQSAYLAALTAHTNYWTNCDVALFILSHLFPSYGPR